MSYVPALPGGGYIGWLTLKRTKQTQQAVFDNQSRIKREEAYFREKIASVKTAEDLVSDRRLLTVALGAFGLEDDINNRAFIRKVLEKGTLREGALATRLSDKRYGALSSAFGFGDLSIPNTVMSDFPDRILKQWKERGFEVAVGKVDDSLRLAMNAQREVTEIARRNTSDAARWYGIMGQRPLRQVFETVFGLPTAFGLLDIERQQQILRQKTNAMFGDGGVAQFADPAKMERLVQTYLIKVQSGAASVASQPGQTALTLLSQMSLRR